MRYRHCFCALLATLSALALITAGCGSHETSPPPPDKATSPVVRAAVALQESLLAAPLPPAAHAEAVRRYFHYSRLLSDSKQRAMARDAFFAEWTANPRDILLVEVAVVHGSRLGRPGEIQALLEAAAGSDTSAAIYHFVRGRRDWGVRAGAGAAFRRAAELAAAGEPLLAAWSQLRAARLDADEGRVDDGVARLARVLRPAWEAGGPTLTTILWLDFSLVTRRADRLNDALAAARMAEACALAAADPYQGNRARLALGNAQLQRGRPRAAAELFAACYTEAADSGWVRLQSNASGFLAMAAQAAGDLAGETAAVERLLAITRAHADTSGSVRAGTALANCLRRAGDLAAAERWLAWCDSVDAVWRATDMSRSIKQERAVLFNQIGRYAEAESLRANLGEDPSPERRREAAVLQQTHLIRQGIETNRPDLAYRALARAIELEPATLPRSPTFDTALHLALAAALLHARQGEYRLADAQLRAAEAREVRGNLRKKWFLADARGKVAREAGDVEAARAAFTRAAALADSLGEADLLRRSREHLSATLLEIRQYAVAESLVTDGLAAPEYWTRLHAHLATGMARAGRGDHDAALAAFAAADTVLGADPPADLGARLGLEQGRSLTAFGRWREAYAQLAAARRFIDGNPGSVTELGRSFNRRIRREIAEATLVLLRAQPRLADPAGAVAASREIAAWARGGQPAGVRGPRIEYFIGDQRAYAWATVGRQSGFLWADLPAPGSLADLVEAVITDMAYPDRDVDREAVRRLGAALLSPLADLWPQDTVLEIASDGFLAAVPWGALTWPGSAHAVLERGPLAITVGAAATEDAASRGSGLLAVGVDGEVEAGGPRLTQAEAEARAVAATWQDGSVALRVGAAGNLGELLPDGLRGYRVVHISSHARVYEGLDGHAAIHVAGSLGRPLTIDRIITAGTDADLVYLSSCEGARQHRSPARGVLSFADAFLAAGAGAVVATSVLMDDVAGRALAENFYRHWQTGKAGAVALRAALLDLRSTDPRWDHPFYWGFANLYTKPASPE